MRTPTRTRAALTAVSIATCFALGPSIAAHAASSPYCSKLSKLMDSNSLDKAKSPGEAAKKMQALAKALRASNPPSDMKKTVADYADVMDRVGGKLKGANDAAAGKVMADFVKDPKTLAATKGIVTFLAKRCA